MVPQQRCLPQNQVGWFDTMTKSEAGTAVKSMTQVEIFMTRSSSFCEETHQNSPSASARERQQDVESLASVIRIPVASSGSAA